MIVLCLLIEVENACDLHHYCFYFIFLGLEIELGEAYRHNFRDLIEFSRVLYPAQQFDEFGFVCNSEVLGNPRKDLMLTLFRINLLSVAKYLRIHKLCSFSNQFLLRSPRNFVSLAHF